MPGSVAIRIPAYGVVYTFSGVLSIQHSFSLKIRTEEESAYGSDLINGARNQPDRLVLAVIETDVGHPSGWADRMVQVLESLKRNRILCMVETTARTYSDMLLSEVSITVDESSQSGWKGNLTFTQYVPSPEELKTDDNSSTPVHTGTAGNVQTVSGTALDNMLSRAGVS